MGGIDGGGLLISPRGWCPPGLSVCLPLVILPSTMKSRSFLLAPAHPGGPGKRAVKWLWCAGGVWYSGLLENAISWQVRQSSHVDYICSDCGVNAGHEGNNYSLWVLAVRQRDSACDCIQTPHAKLLNSARKHPNPITTINLSQ